MNHCFNCNSRYSVPGTCNCFAPGEMRAPKLTVTSGYSAPFANDSTPQGADVTEPVLTWTPPVMSVTLRPLDQ